MNKKGTASDVVFAAVMLFMLALGIFLIGFIGDKITTGMQNTTAFNQSTEATAALEGSRTTINRQIDYIVFGVFIGLILTILITSWFIGANPLFFFIYFIVITIGIVISAILSNTWESITTKPQLASYLTNMPIANHLLTYLPLYVGALGVMGLIIMFAKPYVGRSGGEGGL